MLPPNVTHGHPGADPAPVVIKATRSTDPTAPPAKIAASSRLSLVIITS
jgi:hypothetical protein